MSAAEHDERVDISPGHCRANFAQWKSMYLSLLDARVVHSSRVSTPASITSSAMAAAFTLLSLLAPLVAGQAYDIPDRDQGAFQYVQPLNTTILGPYGNSPPVLPSREHLKNECFCERLY